MKSAILTLLVPVILAGCTTNTPQPTARLDKVEISPSIDSVFVNKSVDFELVDSATGELVEPAGWRIASPHNVPGDRGVMRSDGRYTAPRLAPEPPTVQIKAKSGGHWTQAEFVVVNPDWPPEGTPRPGDSHLHPVYGAPPKIITSKPIDSGLRTGESVRFTAFDMTGRPLVVHHYEVEHQDEVVDYAGSITHDGVYTAPSVVPEPPRVRINILYYREGAEPGSLALIGPSIKILP